MSFHAAFRDHLLGLANGDQIVAAYNAYKQADDMLAYALNGCLKGGHKVPKDVLAHFQNLCLAIRARNTAPLNLYRMTSDKEFVGPLLPVIRGDPFRYPAFLSTSGRNDNLGIFVPNTGNPLLLEIRCPVGTTMALLEAEGGLEDEYLLGAGTEFEVVGHEPVQDPSTITALTGADPEGVQMFRLILSVRANPTYTNAYPLFDFDPQSDAGDVAAAEN